MVKYAISNKIAVIILLYFQVFLLKLNHARLQISKSVLVSSYTSTKRLTVNGSLLQTEE